MSLFLYGPWIRGRRCPQTLLIHNTLELHKSPLADSVEEDAGGSQLASFPGEPHLYPMANLAVLECHQLKVTEEALLSNGFCLFWFWSSP